MIPENTPLPFAGQISSDKVIKFFYHFLLATEILTYVGVWVIMISSDWLLKLTKKIIRMFQTVFANPELVEQITYDGGIGFLYRKRYKIN